MFGFSPNQILNVVLAMVLAAVATAASLELRSQPIEVSKLVSDAAEILAAGPNKLAKESETSSEKIALAREVVIDAAVQAEMVKEATGSLPSANQKNNAPTVMAELASARTPSATDASTLPAQVSEPVAAKPEASAKEAAQMPATTATAEKPSAPAPAAAVPPAPAKEIKMAALPSKPGVIFEDLGHKACIGGTQCEAQCKAEPGGCEVKQTYTIKLEQPTYISAVQFFAHDQVGPSRRSELFVKVNGESIGKTEAHRYGSTRTVKVGRVGQLVTIESRHKHNGFLMGGEEAVIWDVYLLGREAR